MTETKETKEQFERRRFQEICFSKLDDLRAVVTEIGDMNACDEDEFWKRVRLGKYTATALSRIITMHQLYTALQNHRYQPQMIKLNLAAFLESLISYTKQIAKKDAAQLTGDFKESIEITTDPYLISVILGQLFSNAFGSSMDGEPVTLFFEEEENFVHISVMDKVGGIRENGAIFEAYFVECDGLYSAHLGLPLSRRAAEFLGGTFKYAKCPSVGTMFTFSLPLTEKEGQSMDLESYLDGCKQILWNMMADMVAYPWLPGQPIK